MIPETFVLLVIVGAILYIMLFATDKKEKQKLGASKSRNGHSVGGSSNAVLESSRGVSATSRRNSKFADISHKHSTGATNWQKFLQENAGDSSGRTKITSGQIRSQELNTTKRKLVTKSSLHSGGGDVKMTRFVAMDCEMVGVGEGGRESMLARVSIVNSFGDCVYDKFVKPREPVTDYRTHVSGVRECDLVNGEDFETVQREVADILRRRILVGHSIQNDLEALFLSHPWHSVRDTAKFFRRGGCKTPSLRALAAQYLNASIQQGEHSSVQDARAAMMLYNMYKKEWELGGGNRKHNRIDTYHHKIRNPHLVADT